MIRKWSQLAGLVVAAVILLAGTGFAQDFSQLMDAVDKLEGRLKEMIQTETSSLRKELADVRLELTAAKQGKTTDTAGPDLQSLTNEVAQLRARLLAAPTSSTDGNIDNQQLATILGSIDRLNQEMAQLRTQTPPSPSSAAPGVLSQEDLLTVLESVKRLDAEVAELKTRQQPAASAANAGPFNEENLLTILTSIGLLNQEVAQIRNQLQSPSVPPAAPAMADQDMVTVLQSIEHLNQEVARLKTQNQPGNAATVMDQQDLITIVNSIEYLNTEVARLRGLVAAPGAQLASVEPEDGAYATKADVEKVAEHLVNIYDRLNRVEPVRVTAARPDGSGRGITEGLTMAGFVDASASSDYRSSESSFRLDQVEVDVLKEFSGKAALRADIEYLSDGLGDFEMGLEQGYLNYNIGTNNRLALYFGRFESPVGFEGVDPTDRYQYSDGLVSEFSLPSSFTGVMVWSSPFKWFDWTFCVANGWDINADNNKDKTFVTRLGFTPIKSLNFGLAGITGAEKPDNNSSRRTVLDLSLTWEPLPTWLVGGDFNYGYETKTLPGGADGHWLGFLVVNNFALGHGFDLTGRFDYFNDADGLRTDAVQERNALSVSPSLELVEDLVGRLELRYDWSNVGVFRNTHGGEDDNRFSTAVEFTYGF
jgi:hypothetical protein